MEPWRIQHLVHLLARYQFTSVVEVKRLSVTIGRRLQQTEATSSVCSHTSYTITTLADRQTQQLAAIRHARTSSSLTMMLTMLLLIMTMTTMITTPVVNIMMVWGFYECHTYVRFYRAYRVKHHNGYIHKVEFCVVSLVQLFVHVHTHDVVIGHVFLTLLCLNKKTNKQTNKQNQTN